MASEHINALRIGAVVEEYRIERLLGHGGFGMTYLARDLNLNTLVAIKEYLPQEFAVRAANSTIVPKSANDEQGYTWGLERFKQEARALARFKHPHIVRASRLIEANGTAYMVMDYEHGLTLGDYLKKNGPTLDEARILGVFLPILDGIHALHKAELVHRDIKPGNIYIRAEGGPMLIDFGAVRQAIGAHSRSLTAVVTPGFAPIEQYSSEGKQGPWTDLYAVGATMYTCILGRSPVDAARRSAAISDGDNDPLVSAARIGKGKYSEPFLAAVDWALQFRTRDRPQSALEFKERLKQSPVRPELLEFEDADEDKTAMGAVPREPWAEQAANSAPRSVPRRAAEPETQLSEPRKVAPGGPSRPQAKQIPSGDADVASAPMEWFEPAPEAAAKPASPPKPTPPRGQPTRDPDEDPLAQTNAGLISSAAAGGLGPAAAEAPKAAPAKPKPAPGKAAASSPKPVKPAGGGLIANASARRAPPSGGNALKVVAVLAVLGAAGGGLYWYQSGATDRRDAKLWAAAGRSGSIAGYQSYLAGCENCAKKADAEAAIAALEQAAAAEAASDAQLQKVAELKARFAQHVMAGEIDQPAGDNARTVLDELGRLAPDDVFVISGRERLALMERGRSRAAPVQVAPAPAQTVAPPPSQPNASAPAVAAVPAGRAPATTPAKPGAKETKPASKPAAAPVVDKDALLWDLLAKFEVALANKDLDGGPNSASVSLRALETIAPDDPIVKDVRRRYDLVKAKADASRAAPPPATVVAPAAGPLAQPAAQPAAQPVSPAPQPQPDAAAPAVTAPAAAAPAPKQEAPATPAPPAGTTVRDALGPLGTAPPLIVVPAGSFRMGDLQGVGNADEQPPTQKRMASFAIAKREITVSQFRVFADATRFVTDAERSGGCRVMKDGAWTRDPRANWRNPPFSQTDEEPVVCVSAADAGAYAAWLAQVTGAKYRLPTEAEWEYAARAGTDTAWWWGAAANGGQANCEGCEGRARPRTLEVGGYGKNAWGLFDTAGNVWEWTCSAYGPRLGGGEDQCVNLKSENQIVMRGGSWATPVDRLRSSTRGFAAMSYASDNVGFRVVREY